jgi:uncharacterized protein YdeI (YjbR/CyaY-like superfamily)
MEMTDPNVDEYLFKAPKWHEEIAELRRIVLSCGLQETWKWRQPCYTYKGKNLIILGSFKESCVISFLMGSSLADPEKLLERPGEHTQTGRFLRFKGLQEIQVLENVIRSYVIETMEQLTSEKKAIPDTAVAKIPIPEELSAVLDTDEEYRNAFMSLTTGRQRAYLMHFTATKVPDTRIARINRFRPRIIAGKGMTDCICGLSKKRPGCDGSHRELGPDWVKPFA